MASDDFKITQSVIQSVIEMVYYASKAKSLYFSTLPLRSTMTQDGGHMCCIYSLLFGSFVRYWLLDLTVRWIITVRPCGDYLII